MQGIRCAVAMILLAGTFTLPGCVSSAKRKAEDERRQLEEAQRELDAKFKDKPAPDFELTTLDGQKVKLSDQKGKPVLLAFFAFG